MDKSKDKICEVVMIDGCKVIMKYTQTPKPEVMDRVKDTLFTERTRNLQYFVIYGTIMV